MDNFVFKVFDIQCAGSFAVIQGKHYSGMVKYDEKLRFAGSEKIIDSLGEDITNISVSSFHSGQSKLDVIVADMPHSEEFCDVEDKHIWMIDTENNPCMVVDTVFNITGKGIVVTGCIASGQIRVGDEMSILTPDGVVKSVVIDRIEYSQESLDVANEGDRVEFFLKGIRSKYELPIGSLLCGKLKRPMPEMVNEDTALVVSDIFYVAEQNVVVTGKVLVDYLKVGDVVQFQQSDSIVRNVIVKEIERDGKQYNDAKCGDDVCISFKGLRNKNEISIGTQIHISKRGIKPPVDAEIEKVNINLGDCILTMVHIPGNGDMPGFYVSETPVTIQQYKALFPKDDPDLESWIEYYEKYETREYVGFTVASACTVEHMIDFLNKIRQPIFYCLPSREQWLHLAENHYERVKWCSDCEFLGTEYQAIAWEMMRDNSYNIYCLLGVEYDANGNRIIKGNNFVKSERRDNIAFRLVCSEFEINSYYK